MARTEPIWTLDELEARAALALAENYEGQPNGQVRDLPDRRTIRYYTTLGLIDRPAELRGRTAWYGLRHLYQIVAIKRLQARGLSLAEVQRQLIGLPNAALRRLARLSEDVARPPATPFLKRAADPARSDFWKTMPIPAEQTAMSQEAAASPGEGDLPLQGVPLEREVSVLLAASRQLEREDIQAIRAAAAPLLKLLEKRRLMRPRHERGDS